MITRIKKLCEENGITLTSLERELGFSKSAMSRWDKNAPSFDKAQKVADYFGVTLDYLSGATDDPHSYAEISDEEKAFYDMYIKAQASDKKTIKAMFKVLNGLLGIDEEDIS